MGEKKVKKNFFLQNLNKIISNKYINFQCAILNDIQFPELYKNWASVDQADQESHSEQREITLISKYFNATITIYFGRKLLVLLGFFFNVFYHEPFRTFYFIHTVPTHYQIIKKYSGTVL